MEFDIGVEFDTEAGLVEFIDVQASVLGDGLAEQLRTFVDLNPDFEVPVERLATWLARLDDEDDDE